MTWVDDFSNFLPIKELYKDLLQPSAREVGAGLGSVAKTARFVLAPFEYLGNLHDRYLFFLKRLHEKVEGKNLQEVSPQLSGPVLEGLRFLEDDSLLAEMFINILARALDRETASTAHPAFVEILKQLSPDEALILYKIKKRSYEFHVQLDFDPVENRFHIDRVIRNDFPVDELVYPGNYTMYINHLSYLNVAGIPEYKNQKHLYDDSGLSTHPVSRFR